MNEFVVCKICDFKGKDIRSHIRSKHNINSDNYKKKYGELISELTKFKRRKSNIIAHNSASIKKIKSDKMKIIRKNKKWASFGMKGKTAWNKGLTIEDERVKKYVKSTKKTKKSKEYKLKIENIKKKISFKQKERLKKLKENKNAWNLYIEKISEGVKKARKNKNSKYHTFEYKEKQRQRLLNNNPVKNRKVRNKISKTLKNFYLTSEGKNKASKIGKKNALKYWNNVKKAGSQKKLHGILWERKRSINCSNAQSKSSRPNKCSKGELEVKSFLETLNIVFKHDKYFKEFVGRPDFSFEKLNKIIEYNGCYWHNHDCMNIDISKDKRLRDNIVRWESKIKYCVYNKIGVLIVWECEWKSDRKSVEEKIVKFLK